MQFRMVVNKYVIMQKYTFVYNMTNMHADCNNKAILSHWYRFFLKNGE